MATSTRLVSILVTGIWLMVSVPGAVANDDSVDLRDEFGVKIVGAAKVASAGDITGDGIRDVLVSGGKSSQGRTWVIFGPFSERTIRLDNLGDGGFLIEGASEGDNANEATGLGDVNGDGLDDIGIGAQGADNNDRVGSGTVYVVFGKKTTETIELSHFDLGLQLDKGYRIDGPAFHAIAGADVAGPGDVNGDGLTDVAVSAPFAGATYLVFGKTDTTPVDLKSFEDDVQGDTGYRIDTPTPSRNYGYSLGAAGDVNGDATPDLVIGVIPTLSNAGSAYVVFGKADTASVKAKKLGNGGFRVWGTFSGASVGYSSDGAGDVNADGLADIVIGAPAINCCGSGAAFVVFGKKGPKPVYLKTIGKDATGYRIKGAYTATYSDVAGISVAGIGDVNGDGRSDVVVGAMFANHRDRKGAGAAYIIFGKRSSQRVLVSMLGSHGHRIDGATRDDSVGSSVAAAGDVNGDGSPDVLVGAPTAGPKDGRERYDNPGASYIVWHHP